MRVSLIFLVATLLIVSSCKDQEVASLQQELITAQFVNIIGVACNIKDNYDSAQNKTVVISKEKIELSRRKFSVDYYDFNMQAFLVDSQEIEYDLHKIPAIDGVNVRFVDQNQLPNLYSNTDFGESIHGEYATFHPNQYCKALIVFKPRVRYTGPTTSEIIVRAIKYFEYKIEDYTYLIKIDGKEYSFSRLREKRNGTPFH